MVRRPHLATRSPPQAAVVGRPAIGILTVTGLAAVWGCHQAGFRGVWPHVLYGLFP